MTDGRICFVLPSAYGYFNDDASSVGGGARQLSFVSTALADRFEMHFVVGDYGQPRREQFDGVTVHRSYRQEPDTSGLRKFVELARAMYRADADLYLYRGRPIRATATYVVARLLGSDWLYNLASDRNLTTQAMALPTPVRQCFRYAVGDAAAVIAQSEAQAAQLELFYDRTAEIVPSGYPEAERIPDLASRDAFLWVGRLEATQKRPARYLELAERLPETEFLLIGPGGDDEVYTERIVDRASALDNVTYLGFVPPDEIDQYYQRAIALVNTSRYEGFPSTYLEAWRYRTPVLALSVDPARYVGPAVAGFADDDFEQLVADAQRLATSVSAREQYARPAYDYFREHLTLDRVAERYAALFEQVTQR